MIFLLEKKLATKTIGLSLIELHRVKHGYNLSEYSIYYFSYCPLYRVWQQAGFFQRSFVVPWPVTFKCNNNFYFFYLMPILITIGPYSSFIMS